ncbi:MAG: hypothetical protein LBK53_07425 [Heliobacteriaceae bacterium]|jgi:hypothetical protein|nr:hypothetical protein [Heliobacteriaceae bacterium]
MKLLKLLLIFILLITPVYAEIIQVEALQDFTTEKPSKTMQVKIKSDICFDGEQIIPQGTELIGTVFDVKSPKRLKRNASFSFIPTDYIDQSGQIALIKNKYIGIYTAPVDKSKILKTAALTAGNIFITPGFSTGVNLFKGAVKNEDGNRLKSGITEAYKDSPLSYTEKGTDIYIKKGEVFLLNFFEAEINEPNYQYETKD